MGVKSTVFASKPERGNFYKLHRQWGTKYVIFHNLPFLNVFTTDSVTLSQFEWNGLKKTSIDYTLCSKKNDRPILCIEFDGLTDGVNVGTSYLPSRPGKRSRGAMLNLKLQVAHSSRFPYFVVGSTHFKDLSSTIKLNITDGIIGEVLSMKIARRRISSGFRPEEMGYSQEGFDSLGQSEKHEVIEDWELGVEIDADLENNPIHQKVADLMQLLSVSARTVEYRHFPGIADDANPAEGVSELDSALYVGATVKVRSRGHEEIEETVMLPNFRTPGFGFDSALELAEKIAHLLCLDRLQREARKAANG